MGRMFTNERIDRLWRRFVSITVDLVLVGMAYAVALLLRFEGDVPRKYWDSFLFYIPIIAFAYVVSNYLFRIYRRLWRYASSLEVAGILASVTLATVVLGVADFAWVSERPLPVTVVLTGGGLTLGAFAVVRYRWRLITGLLWRLRAAEQGPGSRVLIVGAGEEGQLLAWRLKNLAPSYEVVGYIDDDPKKAGMTVHGDIVFGARERIPQVIKDKDVDMIVIAIQRISGEDFRSILDLCQNTAAKIKLLPSLSSFMEGEQPLLRDITVEDLLGRDSVPFNQEAASALVEGKRILVTGAGGSIGGELSRQLLRLKPGLLVLLDNNETALHELSTELSSRASRDAFECVVADIRSRERLRQLFQEHTPQIVFHCAAYKHVPIMEEHPYEAFQVNVVGTRHLLDLAWEQRVERFVFISTDKAVEPKGVMGASKRIGEILTTSMPANQVSRFTAVRFGNVLGSRGSVVPTFLRQIQMGGPITVTHPDMTRFFMGLPEAASLIIQAASLTSGGDIFMLEMGQEIRILDLAHKLVRMKGLRVNEDIKIVFSGLRPGEKLHESLVVASEKKLPTSHPHISIVPNQRPPDQRRLLEKLDELQLLVEKGRCQDLGARLMELAYHTQTTTSGGRS